MTHSRTGVFGLFDLSPEHGRRYLPLGVVLVDMTGRLVARGKRGRLDPNLAPILDRQRLSAAQWTAACIAFGDHYRNGDLRLKQTV